MRLIDLLRLIADNLSRRKGRVVLTAIGVVIGTAAVVLLVSLAGGLQASATQNLYGISDLTRIDVYPNYMDMGVAVEKVGGGGGGGSGQQNIKLLTPSSIKEIEAIPGVATVIPRDYLQGGAILRVGRLENYASIMGVGVDDLSIFGYTLAGGVQTLNRGEAVIGGWMAKNWYDPKARPGQEPPQPPDLLGQSITLVLQKWVDDGTGTGNGMMVEKKVKIKIVGVYEEQRNEADGFMFLRLDEVTGYNEWFMGKRINRQRDGYQNIVVKSSSADNVLDVTDAINNLGYMASTAQGYVQGINSFFVVLQVAFGGVGAIALIVAAIGIANTMTMAILERTREIGLMKAVGATNRDVLSIFLGEAAGIGLIGGLGGVLIGWAGSYVLNIAGAAYFAGQTSNQGGMPPPSVITVTPMWLPIGTLVFAIIVGLLSGLYPSLRAATLVPVNALKYE